MERWLNILSARGETSVIDVFHDYQEILVKVTETSHNGKLLSVKLLDGKIDIVYDYTDMLMAAKPNYWRNW